MLALGAALAAWRPWSAPDAPASTLATAPPAYVGSARCTACHAPQAAAWRDSQHAHAMQPATPDTVLGRFDGKTLRHGASTTRYFLRDGRPQVTTEGADGTAVTLDVTHTFGIAPLQQYLVDLPDGRKQSLGVAWDARPATRGGQRWFHVFPGPGTRPGDPLHWSGIDQNWNYQCADCHATGLIKGYDAAANRFATTSTDMHVACEACHGPGSAHLAWADSAPDKRPALAGAGLGAPLTSRHASALPLPGAPVVTSSSRQAEIEVCARCHARRGQFSDDHRAGDALLDHFRPALIEPGLYFADGQQRDEVFTWGSFLQSRMHAAGVTCSDCHEPHAGTLRAPGNAVCTQCHAATAYDAATHHHHREGGEGAACIACHMPATTYMGVDPRHDHSLRLPQPTRSAALGTPDACTGCHAREGAAWTAAAVRRWFAQPRAGHQIFAEPFAASERREPGAAAALIAIVRDRTQGGLVRASALLRLPAPLDTDALAAAAKALDDADDIIRYAAVRALSSAEPAIRAYHLAPRLTDARRLVRIEAAHALAGEAEHALDADAQRQFAGALAEAVAAERFNADRPEANTRLGDLYAARGDAAAAQAAYRDALARDAGFVPAWLHWANLTQRRDETATAAKLREGLARVPASAELRHALGLSLVRQGRAGDAVSWLVDAARAAPDNPRYAYVAAVALHDTGKVVEARRAVTAALARHPHDAALREAALAWR